MFENCTLGELAILVVLSMGLSVGLSTVYFYCMLRRHYPVLEEVPE